MKRFLLYGLLILQSLAMIAVPAKRGVWKTLKLTDGTEVRAQLVGDEFSHYWLADDGKTYLQAEDELTFKLADVTEVQTRAKARRQQVNGERVKRLAPRKIGTVGNYFGEKKGIVILVNFSDVKFQSANNNAFFQRMANEKDFKSGNFVGSMYDYFYDQSDGKFELTFDIVGPVTVSKKQSYYGANDANGDDKYPATMIVEAVKLADSEVNYADYDWDGDGYVDQVYVIYAGKGEADSGIANTIWPHAYDLYTANYYGDGAGPQKLDGVTIDTYACGSELEGSTGKIAGIGTMCHEFSHCLGYPDFYDTDYSGGQGMFTWDLMDAGSYNGNSYRPAGYTTYERWMAGWREPIELTKTQQIDNMAALNAGGDSYIIYNTGNRNEYYLLENRQQTGWDAGIPGNGLLIVHADYQPSAWQTNTPNDDPSHQRMTWIPADNKYQYEMVQGYKSYTTSGAANDPFPYGSVNAFNKSTTPAAKWYNKAADKTYYMDASIENITRNNDGTISFKFKAAGDDGGDDPIIIPTPSGEPFFYESFDLCNGKGGNDGAWSGSIATAAFQTDNAGWTSSKSYGASKCAKFGTGTVAGTATTPTISMSGEGVLTFKAGAWNASGDKTTLTVTASNGTVTPSTFTMTKGDWTDFSALVKATGSTAITFTTAGGRFFLDEVKLYGDGETGIESVSESAQPTTVIYNLSGQRVTTPTKGLYIINGKKVLIK